MQAKEVRFSYLRFLQFYDSFHKLLQQSLLISLPGAFSHLSWLSSMDEQITTNPQKA